jgi:hypothetical protein
MLKVVELENAVSDAEQAVGADTIIKVAGPLIEGRVESLVRSIIAAPVESLPELRGALAEVWNLLNELRRLAAKKQSADETFTRMFRSH